MSLANSTSIQVKDPSIDQSKRFTEIKLDDVDTVYLSSSLKLVNLGYVANPATNYNDLAGILGSVKRMTLYDGKQVLAQQDEFNRWNAFKNTLHENSENESKRSHLMHNKMGFRLRKHAATQFPQVKNGDVSSGQSDTTQATAAKGGVYLSDCFDLLQKMPFLHTGVFKNLRLRVEYESDERKIVNRDNATATATSDDVQLVCEILTDQNDIQGATEQALNMIVPHNEYVHDSFQVAESKPVGATNATPNVQTVSALLNAYNGKYINRMVMMNEYSDAAKYINANLVLGAGSLGSQRQFRTNIQARVNGANLLPDGGIGTSGGTSADAMLLARLVETWGEQNNYYSSFTHQLDGSTANQEDGVNREGQMGYVGFVVEAKIQNLQLEMKRSNVYDTSGVNKTGEALRVHVFGECRKLLSVSNGKYMMADNV
jgi:hypothetical protein